MFCRDFMPRSNDAALQEREGRFNTIHADIAPNIYAFTMVDPLVVRSMNTCLHHRFWIGNIIVGHYDVHILANILTDELCQCARLNILSVEKPQYSIALSDPNNYFLILERAALSVFSVKLSTNVCFVNLDNA